ncbi:MAG TPA: DNA/RNA nuclease SfsA [Desulfurivibrionaceae bacterium]|nr:DNA/RNA nuclease SfsA [Desulfurivibrionaceae bacterium]
MPGHLVRRYKRFLADVRLADGVTVTVHCPNSGSMQGCVAPESPVRLSQADNPNRKYPFTLEMIAVEGVWVGINTSLTNRLVREGLEEGVITDFVPVAKVHAEVKVSARSRLDFRLDLAGGRLVYLEVKNCTLAEKGVAMFPDAVTARGARHLEELMALAAQGHGAAVLFCVQRADAESFAPAAHIDPHYAMMLAKAARAGVQVAAWQAMVTPEAIAVSRPLPVLLHGASGA